MMTDDHFADGECGMGGIADKPRSAALVWVAVVVGLVISFWVVTPYVSEIIDDAFISFRYARNLAEGRGLVFNEGERVEGYTNFLWVLIMAAGHKGGVDLPWLSRALSTLCAALLVVAVAIFSRSRFRESPHPLVSYLAPAMLALNPLYLQHIGTCMATLPFALLLFLSFAARTAGEDRRGSSYLTGLLLGLAYLTRPEAVLWACGFIAVDVAWALLKREEFSDRARDVAKYALVFGAIVTAHVIWRFSYYGEFLPNTYYAKGASNWSSGLFFMAPFLIATGLIPLVVMAAGPFLLRGKWIAYSWVILCITLAHNLRIGGDFIFIGRFMFPVLPLIYLAAQELFRLSLARPENPDEDTSRKKAFRWTKATVIVVVYVLGALAGLAMTRPGVAFSRTLNDLNMLVSDCIVEHTEPSDTIAVMAAGVIPYYSDRPVIDMIGLTDRHIAHHGIIDRSCTIAHQRADSDYVLDRKPEMILLAPPHPFLRRMTYPLGLKVAANDHMLDNPRLWEEYEEVDLDCDVYPTRFFVRKEG